MKLFHCLHPNSPSSFPSSSSKKGSTKGRQSIASLLLKYSKTTSLWSASSSHHSSTHSSSSSSSPPNPSSIDWKKVLKFERSKELEKAFMVLDEDGDGYISLGKLEASMSSLLAILNNGKEPSHEELAFMMAELDKDGDGFLGFEDFREFVFMSSSSSRFGGMGEEEEGAWFHAMDLNNDGVISCEELHEVMVQSLGFKSCTLQECRIIIEAHDSHGHGFLNAQDFRKLLLG